MWNYIHLNSLQIFFKKLINYVTNDNEMSENKHKFSLPTTSKPIFVLLLYFLIFLELMCPLMMASKSRPTAAWTGTCSTRVSKRQWTSTVLLPGRGQSAAAAPCDSERSQGNDRSDWLQVFTVYSLSPLVDWKLHERSWFVCLAYFQGYQVQHRRHPAPRVSST